jgi:hypothetical protein
MGSNPQLQALLQNPGFLSYLKQKLGGQGGAPPPGGMSPVGPGGTAPFQPQGAAPGALPTGQPPSQALPPQAGPPPGQNPSPYKIQNDPNAGVGSLPKPVEQPMTKLPQWSGGPVAGFLQLLTSFYNKKQESQHAEAANAAQALMQAIDGAKQTGDWTPVSVIMHNNEKLFNKVYKGWLQKSEMQQQEKQKKPEKPDPEVQGVEQGIQQYIQKKQKGGGPPSSTGASPQGQQPAQGQAPQGPPPPQGMPPGAPPPGGAPRSMGGYQIPQAGPQQRLAQQGASAELQAQRQDPGRSLTGQLSSPEQRQVELTKTGMATTPAEQAKLQAEMVKYQSEMTKSATELQIATANAQREQAMFQRAQTEATSAGEKGKLSVQEGQQKLDKAKIDVDIAKVRYQTAQMGMRSKGQAKKVVSIGYQTKIASTQAALAMIQDVQKQNRGFSYNEVQKLQQELKTAGASSLATDLPSKWFNWMHGTGQVNDFADRVDEYKTSLEKSLAQWQAQFGGATTEEGTTPVEGKVDEVPDETIDEDFDDKPITQEELDKFVAKKKKLN